MSFYRYLAYINGPGQAAITSFTFPTGAKRAGVWKLVCPVQKTLLTGEVSLQADLGVSVRVILKARPDNLQVASYFPMKLHKTAELDSNNRQSLQLAIC